MGLITNFLGLIFGGGYLAYQLISTRAEDRADAKHRRDFDMAFKDVNARFCNRELEAEVERLSRGIKQEDIMNILKNEVEYISRGDSHVNLTQDQIVALLLSRFGKIRWLWLHRFGGKNLVGDRLDSYTVSKRVMQCIESNIKAATGYALTFGVSQTASCYGGNYYGGEIKIDYGTPMYRPIRIYESVSIPFQPLKISDLEDVTVVNRLKMNPH